MNGNTALSYGPYYRTSQRSKQAEREALGMPALSPEAIAGERYGELSAYLGDENAKTQLGIQKGYLGISAAQMLAQKKQQQSQASSNMVSGAAALGGTALSLAQETGVTGAIGNALGITSAAETGAITSAPTVTGAYGSAAAIGEGVAPVALGGEAALGTEAATGFGASAAGAEGAGFGGILADVGGFITGAAESAWAGLTWLVGLLFTVICTELYRQGLTSKRMLMADLKFGKWVMENDPYTYIGYHQWAPYVVKLMRKSKLFTKFVCIFALPWQKEMAYRMGFLKKGNLFGYVLMEVGVPICRHIGKRVGKEKFMAQWIYDSLKVA